MLLLLLLLLLGLLLGVPRVQREVLLLLLLLRLVSLLLVSLLLVSLLLVSLLLLLLVSLLLRLLLGPLRQLMRAQGEAALQLGGQLRLQHLLLGVKPHELHHSVVVIQRERRPAAAEGGEGAGALGRGMHAALAGGGGGMHAKLLGGVRGLEHKPLGASGQKGCRESGGA